MITVGRITAGTTFNVIPEAAEIHGTMRAVSARTRQQLRDGLQRVADGIAAAHGTTATVELDPGYPVTVNDDGFAGFVLDVATDLVGDRPWPAMPNPVMGAEDFSYVLEQRPGRDGLPRRRPQGHRSWRRRRRTTRTAWSSTRTSWPGAVRCTPPWRCGTWVPQPTT